MPSLFAALCLLLAAFANESRCISVPTGKKTPITPAQVTPRPTYHPPAANPAPVVEYNEENPEPAPLNPSWVPIPVKYLNVLTANSILYVPMRIPNPFQPTYYTIPATSAAPTPAVTEATTTYQDQKETYTESREFGAKVTPKQKVKPYYYLPKGQQKQTTKGGYPKKAIAAPSQKYYYYYPYTNNYQ